MKLNDLIFSFAAPLSLMISGSVAAENWGRAPDGELPGIANQLQHFLPDNSEIPNQIFSDEQDTTIPEFRFSSFRDFIIVCPNCLGTGEIDFPVSPNSVPGSPTYPAPVTSSQGSDLEVVLRAINRVIGDRIVENAALDDKCISYTVSDYWHETTSAWNDHAMQIRIIAPSEIFSNERIGYWYSFTLTLISKNKTVYQEMGMETSLWGSGKISRHKFIIDGLQGRKRAIFSLRGVFCAQPILGSVSGNIENRDETEKKIASFFTRYLDSSSNVWEAVRYSDK